MDDSQFLRHPIHRFVRQYNCGGNNDLKADTVFRTTSIGALVVGSVIALDRYMCSVINSYAAAAAAADRQTSDAADPLAVHSLTA